MSAALRGAGVPKNDLVAQDECASFSLDARSCRFIAAYEFLFDFKNGINCTRISPSRDICEKPSIWIGDERYWLRERRRWNTCHHCERNFGQRSRRHLWIECSENRDLSPFGHPQDSVGRPLFVYHSATMMMHFCDLARYAMQNLYWE